MEKSIEDYLHLYLGCEFIGKLKDWDSENHPVILTPKYLEDERYESIKPILRRLEDMTEEEENKVSSLCIGDEDFIITYRGDGNGIGFDQIHESIRFLISAIG